MKIELIAAPTGHSISFDQMSSPLNVRFLPYKQRHCTDVICLIFFSLFAIFYAFFALLAISQGNPTSLVQPSDSYGNICGHYPFESQPYQLYFDISKCLTDSGLSFVCPTTKICVESCPKSYSHYQTLYSLELTKTMPKSFTRKQLICNYDFDPIEDERTILKLVRDGICAPYTLDSEPLLGRCLPSFLVNLFDSNSNETSATNITVDRVNQQMFGINSLTDVIRVILADLYRIKESLLLFILVACLLTLIYMFAVQQCTGFIVTVTILFFLTILFICSAFSWYTIISGKDFVYEYSTVARIVNDFIQLRTIYKIFGCLTTILFVIVLFLVCLLFSRIQLSIILLDEAAKAVFSVLSTLFWTPLIILLFIGLTALIIYIEMCLSTVGKAIFAEIIDNQTIPCIPDRNSPSCVFQQAYGYNDLVLQDTDIVTRGLIQFLVDYRRWFKALNIFAFFWFAAFLFAMEEIVLAGVFANYYWSKGQIETAVPLFYSLAIVIRYHLGSVAFGSLLIALLRYIRMLIEYIQKKISQLEDTFIVGFLLKCFACLFWIFEKFLKFLNKNSYVLIASQGYSFCKATRKAFGYVVSNCLRFLVLVHLTELILFCGTVCVCACNVYLFYRYLQWTEELDQLILRWTPFVVIIGISYLISSLFFSVYDMAIKSFFMCFLQDLDENDGSIQRPYVMSNELLHLVNKSNEIIEKNEKQQHTNTPK